MKSSSDEADAEVNTALINSDNRLNSPFQIVCLYGGRFTMNKAPSTVLRKPSKQCFCSLSKSIFRNLDP
jgi:hypothetical protein